MFVVLGLLFSWVILVSGVCVHDLSTLCHDYKKSDCTTNQWMQINCCEFCGLNSGSSHAVNGHWGQWSSWSACSTSCGNGSMTRTRHCNNPAPANGGLPCPESALGHHTCSLDDCPGTCSHDLSTMCHVNQKSDCATNQWMQINCCHFCGFHSGSNSHAVNGQWGHWSSYSSCSTSCGNGTMTRTRHCNNPAPAHGGSHCHGSANEHSWCNLVDCPVDGHWSSWTNWGSCSASCGNGTMTRSRACNNPVPNHGGSVCHGSSRETQICHLQHCPVGLTCLSCQGAIFPHTCDTVEQCGSHSVCTMERYFDGSGNILYNLGCKDAAFCQSTRLRSASIAEPNITYTDNQNRRNIPVCRECCTTGMCNSAGCGNTGYASPRGPLCFACSQQVTANSCNTIKMCGRDEDCYIEGRQFGSVHYYHSGCKTKTVCDGTANVGIVGRDVKDKSRRQTFSCERCCTGDLCNHVSC